MSKLCFNYKNCKPSCMSHLKNLVYRSAASLVMEKFSWNCTSYSISDLFSLNVYDTKFDVSGLTNKIAISFVLAALTGRWFFGLIAEWSRCHNVTLLSWSWSARVPNKLEKNNENFSFSCRAQNDAYYFFSRWRTFCSIMQCNHIPQSTVTVPEHFARYWVRQPFNRKHSMLVEGKIILL